MQPYLVFNITGPNKSASRKKRNVGTTCLRQQACCLHTELVTFSEIGMDFVILPRTIAFSYCAGVCMYNDLDTRYAKALTGELNR